MTRTTTHAHYIEQCLWVPVRGRVQSATIDCGGNPGFSIENGNFNFICLVVQNCQRPRGNGGAFSARFATIMLGTLRVADNTAGRGGGLYLEGGSGFSFRSFIINNTATDVGGGIFVTGTSFSMVESNVTDNQPDDIACANGIYMIVFQPIPPKRPQYLWVF